MIDDNVSVDSVTLTKFELSVEEFLSDYMAVKANAEISSIRSDIMSGLCFKLRTWLLCKEHDIETRNIYEPDNFWQMFKRDWFPNWFLRRLPVKMTICDTVVIKVGKVCPHIALKVPEDNYLHYEWMTKK